MFQRRLDGAQAVSPDELEATVARMRALGVTKFGDIELGPAPGPAAKVITPEEVQKRREQAEERHRDILFAASRVRPALRSVK
jgi:hypothetical protein